MIMQLEKLCATLGNMHPALPWALLTLVIWLVAYAVRRWAPHSWEWAADLPWAVLFGDKPNQGRKLVVLARKAWQGVPSACAGALVGACASDSDYRTAWIGALAGTLAPVWHELLKAAPWISYRGGKHPAAGSKVRDVSERLGPPWTA